MKVDTAATGTPSLLMVIEATYRTTSLDADRLTSAEGDSVPDVEAMFILSSSLLESEVMFEARDLPTRPPPVDGEGFGSSVTAHLMCRLCVTGGWISSGVAVRCICVHSTLGNSVIMVHVVIVDVINDISVYDVIKDDKVVN